MSSHNIWRGYDKSPFKEGNFDITYKGKIVSVQISKILNETHDSVLPSIRDIKEIGVFLKEPQFPPVLIDL